VRDLATECNGDDACPASQRCDTSRGRCVACLPERDGCGTGLYCAAGEDGGIRYACVPGCKSDDDCRDDDAGGVPDGGPGGHCNLQRHACAACAIDDDCGADTICMDGDCVPGCSATHPCGGALSCCGGSCVDLKTDSLSC